MPYTQAAASPAPESAAAELPSAKPGADDQTMCTHATQPCFVWQSADLLQGHKRVHIAHNGGVYQLQATRQGKLILTK